MAANIVVEAMRLFEGPQSNTNAIDLTGDERSTIEARVESLKTAYLDNDVATMRALTAAPDRVSDHRVKIAAWRGIVVLAAEAAKHEAAEANVYATVLLNQQHESDEAVKDLVSMKEFGLLRASLKRAFEALPVPASGVAVRGQNP